MWDLVCEAPRTAELEETLLRLMGRSLVEDVTLLLPLDCKLESMPVATQDGMPIMPLGVKN